MSRYYICTGIVVYMQNVKTSVRHCQTVSVKFGQTLVAVALIATVARQFCGVSCVYEGSTVSFSAGQLLFMQWVGQNDTRTNGDVCSGLIASITG